jgi:hypothetical protein
MHRPPKAGASRLLCNFTEKADWVALKGAELVEGDATGACDGPNWRRALSATAEPLQSLAMPGKKK